MRLLLGKGIFILRMLMKIGAGTIYSSSGIALLGVLLLTSRADAALSSGADGFFRPGGDITLTLPADGIFQFTGVQIDSDVNVTFDGIAPAISWLAINDIVINGSILAPGASLRFEPAISFSLGASGRAEAGNIAIASPRVSLAGSIAVSSGGSINLIAGDQVILERDSRIAVDDTTANLDQIDVSGGIFTNGNAGAVTLTLGGVEAGGYPVVIRKDGGRLSLEGSTSISIAATGDIVGGDQITVVPQPVPVPAALPLLFAGLGSLAVFLRAGRYRRHQNTT
jgi:hypothetical protein